MGKSYVNAQPAPFEFRRGILVDACGRPVRFRNPENLKLIASYMNPDQNPDVQDALDEVDSIYSNLSVECLEQLGQNRPI